MGSDGKELIRADRNGVSSFKHTCAIILLGENVLIEQVHEVYLRELDDSGLKISDRYITKR